MIQNQTFTTIGKATSMQGNFNFVGTTHVLGKLEGEITVQGHAKLVLEIGSHTNAVLHCNDLEIYGEFTGEIKSQGLVTLYPTAIVNGKIIAKSIEILPGAVVNMNGHTE
ncbi:MAG: polymer-forming cytoskeletal protein [Bdellovibrionales bacterium]|nr:polymer-forming cytoskeletal protein [Bdellovibrionales bacterium]